MKHIHGGDRYGREDSLDFSANINYRGMPGEVRLAALSAVTDSVHYPDPYCRKVRQALARREKTASEEIICGNGAAELLFALCQALRAETAMVPAPSFFEYEQAVKSAGGVVRYLPLRERDAFDVTEALLKTVQQDCPQVLFLANPNNPTGRLLPKALLSRLLRLCASQGTFLVVDESFLDLVAGEDLQQTASAVSMTNEAPSLFVLKSFTKSYAIPGIRFGYGICADRTLLEKMRELLQPWNVSMIAQETAAVCAELASYPRETAALIAGQRETLTSALESFGFTVIPSAANYVLFQAHPGLDVQLAKKKVLIRSCANFAGLREGWYRVCVRGKEENETLVAAIRGIMEEV